MKYVGIRWTPLCRNKEDTILGNEICWNKCPPYSSLSLSVLFQHSSTMIKVFALFQSFIVRLIPTQFNNDKSVHLIPVLWCPSYSNMYQQPKKCPPYNSNVSTLFQEFMSTLLLHSVRLITTQCPPYSNMFQRPKQCPPYSNIAVYALFLQLSALFQHYLRLEIVSTLIHLHIKKCPPYSVSVRLILDF